MSQFNSVSCPDPLDHDDLGMDVESLNVIKSLFNNNESSDPLMKGSLKKNRAMKSELLTLPDDISDAPIYVARAYCEEMQQAYFGHLNCNYVNFGRLKEFSGIEWSIDTIQQYPHLLG